MSKPLDDLLDEQLATKINQESTSAASRFESLKQAIKNKFGFVMGNNYSAMTTGIAKFRLYEQETSERSIAITGKGRLRIAISTITYGSLSGSSYPSAVNTYIEFNIDGIVTNIPFTCEGLVGLSSIDLELFFSKNISVKVGQYLQFGYNYQLL